MTLVEFLHPLIAKPWRDKTLAVLYFKLKFENVESLTAAQIQKALVLCRIPNARNANIPDVFAKSGAFVDSPGSEGQSRLWRITAAGKNHVRELMGLPETEPEIAYDIASLDALIAGLTNPIVKGFINEAATCLKVGALKASIVFVWAGAVRTLQEQV